MIFKFKEFDVLQANNTQKVGTDSMILGALAVNYKIDVETILDIGCGTGVLGLMLSQEFRPAHITAVDIESLNCEEAKSNLSRASFVNEFKIVHADISRVVFPNLFDFIISNPPYFKDALLSENQKKNIARHQNSLSASALLDVVSRNLTADGVFGVVYPFSMEEEVVGVAMEQGLALDRCIRTLRDKTFVRSFMFFKRQNSPKDDPFIGQLVVRNKNGEYTKEYIDLTKNFHFKDLSK